MTLDLYIHGVPNGHHVWGKQDEQDYLNLFYGGTHNNDRLHVDIRKNHAYYTLLCYHHITDFNGRSGSYFGITLRFDCYCSDIAVIYQILQRLFHHHIIGHVLVREGDMLRYTVSNFTSVAEYLKGLENTVVTMLQGMLNPHIDFLPIDSSFATAASGQAAQFNLSDVDSDIILQAIRRHGAIAISKDYASTKELQAKAQFEAQLRQTKSQYESQAREMQGQLELMQNQNHQLTSTVERLKTELEKTSNQPAVSTPQQTSHTHQHGLNHSSTHSHVLMRYLPIANFVLLVVVVVLLFLQGQSSHQTINTLLPPADSVATPVDSLTLQD